MAGNNSCAGTFYILIGLVNISNLVGLINLG